jgi:UDP-2,4-diacetamido-2,4,6-trideoxy-beta-L-altropyranose hydrolase
MIKKIKNILFRADSSFKIGTGHIMRDLVLANRYQKNGHNIIFATQNLEGNINSYIKKNGFEIIILKTNDKKELNKLIKKEKIDFIVFDSYQIDYKFEKYIKKNNTIKILSLDDTYKKHYCDILLNHNIYADKKKYKKLVPKNCKLQCGSKYILLRDEFIKEKKKAYNKHKKIKTILVAMGGADSFNLNIKILKVLKNFKNFSIDIITTSSNQNLSNLKKYSYNQNWINLHIDSNKVAKLMKKSDFAITTPSVTLNELHYMNIPFISIKVADNQHAMHQYIKERNFPVMAQFKKEKLFKLIQEKLKKIR